MNNFKTGLISCLFLCTKNKHQFQTDDLIK
nr:MAG TPA: hypothetical protein [Caudoviricetes sp.]